MFSAIYLVCMMNQPCLSYTDPSLYPTVEVCHEQAKLVIENNQLKSQQGKLPPFEAEYQCVSWEKA
jgi:hypothetical protein